LDKMLVTLEAAQSSGLSVWAGMTCKPNEGGEMCLRNGDPLAPALAELTARNVPLISFMHTDVAYIDACLDAAEGHWSGPIGVYAHTGGFRDNKWVFDGMISPEDYAVASRRWLDRGVQVIGGCCGIRVEHIAKLKELV
ncbi:MAG: homocysteine S-methyltransferase family protein, partial [Methyloligellaceae bacterium]